MKKDDYYPIIFKRKSIRNYDLNPLDNNNLKEISEEVDNLIPLYSNIKTEIKIISTEDVKQRFMKKAPHYLAVFSDTSEGYLTNVGFMLQQMDSFFLVKWNWILLAGNSNTQGRNIKRFKS